MKKKHYTDFGDYERSDLIEYLKKDKKFFKILCDTIKYFKNGKDDEFTKRNR